MLAALLEGMLPLIAPLLPHMAEDAWQNLPYKQPQQSGARLFGCYGQRLRCGGTQCRGSLPASQHVSCSLTYCNISLATCSVPGRLGRRAC